MGNFAKSMMEAFMKWLKSQFKQQEPPRDFKPKDPQV
jgi:hypothetical protein